MDKSKLPDHFRLIIAWLDIYDVHMMLAVGYIAPRAKNKGLYFHTLPTGKGYDTDLIEKWDYLEDIAPEYETP